MNNNINNLENSILSNKNDISTNSIKINSNEDEITYIKNNISKPYVKNIYNVLFYESKTQTNFTGIFYEKVFDVNASINDFIEIVFKIDLEYEDISERNYIKTIHELFDENDNSLYIKSVSNNEYLYFSNRVIIDDNIFIILLQMLKKLNLLLNSKIYHLIELLRYSILKMIIID